MGGKRNRWNIEKKTTGGEGGGMTLLFIRLFVTS